MSHRVIDDALTDARALLHDTDVANQRYSDAELIGGLNKAFDTLYMLRPDAFLAHYSTGTPHYTTSDLGQSTAWPVDDIFFTACVWYTVGWMELRDTEDTDEDRAGALIAAMKTQVLTGR